MQSPILVAQQIYEAKRRKAVAAGKLVGSFAEAIKDSHTHGVVRSTPTCFFMAVPMDLPWGRTWFCSSAVGSLAEMARLLPFDLPYIAFTRREDRVLRFFQMKRFVHLATTLARKNKQ